MLSINKDLRDCMPADSLAQGLLNNPAVIWKKRENFMSELEQLVKRETKPCKEIATLTLQTNVKIAIPS